MRYERAAGRGLASLVLAVAFAVVLAVPALAWQSEGGSKNCGSYISYGQVKFKGYGELQPPQHVSPVIAGRVREAGGGSAGGCSDRLEAEQPGAVGRVCDPQIHQERDCAVAIPDRGAKDVVARSMADWGLAMLVHDDAIGSLEDSLIMAVKSAPEITLVIHEFVAIARALERLVAVGEPSLAHLEP